MILFDGERRYMDVNRPARLVFRLPLADLRRLRIDDLTPPAFLPRLREAWARLLETGAVGGVYAVAVPGGGVLDAAYFATADALPGLHLAAFAPADWPDGELLDELAHTDNARLTARELEVLQLAADGYSAPTIAKELVVSPATVRTHFEHIYSKLGARGRAAAVARAMRLGLIV